MQPPTSTSTLGRFNLDNLEREQNAIRTSRSMPRLLDRQRAPEMPEIVAFYTSIYGEVPVRRRRCDRG